MNNLGLVGILVLLFSIIAPASAGLVAYSACVVPICGTQVNWCILAGPAAPACVAAMCGTAAAVCVPFLLAPA